MGLGENKHSFQRLLKPEEKKAVNGGKGLTLNWSRLGGIGPPRWKKCWVVQGNGRGGLGKETLNRQVKGYRQKKKKFSLKGGKKRTRNGPEM